MLKKLQKLRSEGFTIIEVMIVLAIAGLIILIVLLAVPALQRNGRNTAMKNDASAVTSAINEYKSNNDGKLPDTVDVDDEGNLTISGSGTESTGKLQAGTEANADGNNDPDVGTISVAFKEKCDGSVSPRAAAVWYPVETQSGKAPKCIEN